MKIPNTLLWLWLFTIIYITYTFFSTHDQNIEGFTPKIRSLYRPHIRKFRVYIESFIDKYSLDYFTKKMSKLGIY